MPSPRTSARKIDAARAPPVEKAHRHQEEFFATDFGLNSIAVSPELFDDRQLETAGQVVEDILAQ